MSTKRKKILTECSNCGCTILIKDNEKHKTECDAETSAVEFTRSSHVILSPGRWLLGKTASTVSHRNEFLPPDFFGWEKFNNCLIHPDTLSALGLLPRSCVTVRSLDGEEIRLRAVTLWPCDQLPQLRVSVPGLVAERRIVVEVAQISRLNKISLRPNSSFAYSKDGSLESYIAMYLSNAPVIPGSTISIRYYGQILEFEILDDFEDLARRLKDLNVSTKQGSKIFRLSAMPKVKLQSSGQKSAIRDSDVAKPDPFARIGGYAMAKNDIQKFLIDPVRSSTSLPCSIVISGLTGSGKSLLLSAISDALGTFAFTPTESTLSESSLPIGQYAVLLIDNFEALKGESKAPEAKTQIICRLLDYRMFAAIVMVVNSIDALDLPLRRRFPLEIELTVPNPGERLEILKIVGDKEVIDEETFKALARDTHGFTGADLLSLVSVAKHLDAKDRWRVALRRIRPTGIRQFILEVPDVRWEDIGGEKDIKREIEQAVMWPFQYPQAFARLGVDPPTGILLYGPPGCSKTLIARAIASQSRLNFLSIKGPEIFSKWVGESERAVRELFRRARQVAPVVLFFDEIDAVAGRRGGDSSSGVSDRVLAQLLTELDGLEQTTGVIVLAATNRPETLDGAILRPGRLDRVIYVPLPDDDTRRAIIDLQLSRMGSIGADLDRNALTQATTGYSGAELVALCKQAAFIAMREDIDTASVKPEHFDAARAIVVPRTDTRMLEIYADFSRGIGK